MSALEWKSYGDRGRIARGIRGTYRIVDVAGSAWALSLEPKFTRGMLPLGQFGDRAEAMSIAEECESDGVR